MRTLSGIAGLLVIVGGLNWGLVAIAEFDLVAWIVGEEFGETNVVSRVIYGLVGASAVYLAASLVSRHRAGEPRTAPLAG